MCLLIGSICACVSMFDEQHICVYEQSGYQTITYFTQMDAYSADQPLLFALAGMLGIVFAVVLFFISSKKVYLILVLLLMLLLTLLMSLFQTGFFWQIILDSIYACHNNWLIAWVLGLVYFMILSLLFFAEDKTL